MAAVRPLRIEELAEVLAFDFSAGGIPRLNPDWRWEDQVEAVMSACSSLVIVVDGDSRIVQFAHFSAKEFLMSRRLAESSGDISQYHIKLEPAHTVLAQACLGVLLRLDDSIDSNKVMGFPLAKYAAEHWVMHAQFENVSTHIKDGMKCLFDADKAYLAAWLWIYDEDRPGLSISTTLPEKLEAAPLYYAARFGFCDLAAHLLTQHPEDVHAEGGFEMTPLHASAYHGHFDIFSLLVDHFPNLDIRGYWDQSPLHRTSYGGHLEIGKRLLDRGADIDAREVDGWTPLYIAALNGQLEFARMLLERGAAIHTPSHVGETPLHVASQYGQVQVAQLLMERGADLYVRDHHGRTPSEVASIYGKRDIVRLLSEYLAKPEKE